MEKCPICTNIITYQGIPRRDGYIVNCPRCGEYLLTRQALANLRSERLSEREIANVSGWLRENQNYEITTGNISQLLSTLPPSFHEKADKLLRRIEKLTTYAGEYLNDDPSWLGSSYCINGEELSEVMLYLAECERVKDRGEMGGYTLKISPAGWAHLEGLRKLNPESQQCFVAMWFDPVMQHVYDTAISIAIKSAGYLSHRVDQREHNDKIDDEIIAQIKKSRFVLADFTGHRGGVYYEAGFAKGLDLEVIWTCREDDVENLHFDIRQFNCILWNEDNLDEFNKRIKSRIEAVIGVGPQ